VTRDRSVWWVTRDRRRTKTAEIIPFNPLSEHTRINKRNQFEIRGTLKVDKIAERMFGLKS
jgi:hypothetical protein